MGSVSSLISGHSLHSKHCRASEHRGRKDLRSRRTGRSLDALLRHGLPHESGSNNNAKNEDFFYIHVNHSGRADHQQHRGEDGEGGEAEMRREMTPEPVSLSGKLEKNAEKSLIRPTAFKPVLPRSSSSSVETHNNLSTILQTRLSPVDRPKDLQDLSGTLTDSGRNSMSSLPTHSTSGSSQTDNLSTSTGHLLRYGASTPNTTHGAVNGQNWTNSGGGGSVEPSSRSISVAAAEPKPTPILDHQDLFTQHRSTVSEPNPTSSSQSGGGVRSPISTDESLIQQLERKLLERESELAELQTSLEERESDSCQLFEQKQRYCAEEMAGLKQRCSTKLRQVSQRALRAQQLLQEQVIQLQQDKERLQEEVEQLTQDKEAAENRLRNYRTQQNQLAPTLEETQWEVCQKTGEISLLKQQLRDSQADVVNKLSEIVRLRSSLRDTRIRQDELQQTNSDLEEALRSRTTELEVCQNELHRKKNEADLLREKVSKLETDIKGMKQDLDLAKEEQVQLLSARARLEEQQLQLQVSRAKMDALVGSRTKAANQERSAGSRRGEADVDALQKEVERLRGQLKEEKLKKDKMASSFQQERQTWNTEKSKVIRYQKQLQYNYLQMYRKNQDLEKILRELTAEMDSRTELDMDAHHPDLYYKEVLATEI